MKIGHYQPNTSYLNIHSPFHVKKKKKFNIAKPFSIIQFQFYITLTSNKTGTIFVGD